MFYWRGGDECETNMLITEIPHIKKFYVPPTPDDTSQCIGACYALYLEKNKHQLDKPKIIKNAYLGYEANEKEEQKFLKQENR